MADSGDGDARYRFRLNKLTHIRPTMDCWSARFLMPLRNHRRLRIVGRTSSSREVRYNRLIDLFLGITAYSLQNHLRTKFQTTVKLRSTSSMSASIVEVLNTSSCAGKRRH